MDSPAATVLKRRHLVLMLIRIAALGLIVYGAVETVMMGFTFLPSVVSGSGMFELVVESGKPLVSYAGLGLVLAVVSRRAAAWVVPAGLRSDTCATCGYSLKNLKSPICPECGADVPGRAGAAAGPGPVRAR